MCWQIGEVLTGSISSEPVLHVAIPPLVLIEGFDCEDDRPNCRVLANSRLARRDKLRPLVVHVLHHHANLQAEKSFSDSPSYSLGEIQVSAQRCLKWEEQSS